MCNKSTIDDFVRLDAEHPGIIVSSAAFYELGVLGLGEKRERGFVFVIMSFFYNENMTLDIHF